MNDFDSFFEKIFTEKISAHFEEKQIMFKYSLLHNPNLAEFTDIGDSLQRPDFIILKGRYPYIIVSIIGVNILRQATLSVSEELQLETTGADYFAITNLEQVVIIHRKQKGIVESQNFDEIFNLFEAELTDNEIDKLSNEISDQINKVATKLKLEQTNSIYPLNNALNYLLSDKLKNYIQYNNDGRFFHFRNNGELILTDFENELFQALLEPVSEDSICRYTNLDSVYNMINESSFRMSSYLGMNDRGEIDYVDKYIGAMYKTLQQLSFHELQEMNKSYISSCTTINKIDNLTMYRLYGEDTKGVCLRFKLRKLSSNNLIIRKISYAISHNNHPQLELIKNIIESISQNLKIRFRFIYIDIWKHFFKTHDYSVEEEVRILYIEKNHLKNKQGWVLTSTDKILSKYVTFDLGDINLPIELDKIILGPNCPEAILNKRQFEVLLYDNGLTKIAVENSAIDSYRKS